MAGGHRGGLGEEACVGGLVPVERAEGEGIQVWQILQLVLAVIALVVAFVNAFEEGIC